MPIALLVWIYVIARLLMVIAAWTAERCGAPLVQPRFLEAAAAMRAAGDEAAEKEEEWEAERLAALPAVSANAGPERGRSVPTAAAALGAGVLLGLVVGRRVAGRRVRRGRR